MSRKTKTVIIDLGEDFPRDNGKVFHLEEMSAMAAEKWAMRAMLALTKSGVEIPEGIEGMGFAGVAIVGMRALGGVAFEDLEPLMDEMLECVSIQPDPRQPAVTRPLIKDDIEEVPTLVFLRREVFDLHANFSILGKRLELMRPKGTPDLPNTSTSPDQ